MFGGALTDLVITNLFTSYNFSQGSLSTITHYNFSPSLRYNHQMKVVNSFGIIFGGKSSEQYFGDAWKFDFDNYLYTGLNPTGNFPSPRNLFASDSSGNMLIIWGGQDSNGLLNDIYALNLFTISWSLISTHNKGPSPRKGACLAFYNTDFFLFGGETNNGFSGELWKFDMIDLQYQLVSVYSKGLAYGNCQIVNSKFYINIAYDSKGKIDGINLNFDLKTLKWNKFVQVSINLPKNGGCLILGNYTLLFGGIFSDGLAFSELVIFNKASQVIYSQNLDLKAYSFSWAYYKSDLFIQFGGYSWKSKETGRLYINPSQTSSSFFAISLSEIFEEFGLKIVCSPGTILNHNSCEPCPTGTYATDYGNKVCEVCPVGHTTPANSSSSFKQCLPCGKGYFLQQNICLQCESSNYCPTGSVSKTGFFHQLSTVSIQPNPFQPKSANFVISLTGIILTLLTSVIILILIFRGFSIFKSFDFFINNHNYQLGGYMLNKKNECGGIFSIILISSTIYIFIYALILYELDNISETKVLQPLPLLEKLTDNFEFDFEVSTSFLYYRDDCVTNNICSKEINVSITGILIKNSEITCEYIDNSCMITFNCYSCVLEDTSYIDFYLSEKFSYSSGISVNVSSSSSIPESISSIFTAVYPDDNLIFIGPIPTTFEFIMTPSLFISTVSGFPSQLVGHHVTLKQPPTKGSQFNVQDSTIQFGVSVQVVLSKYNSGIFTNRFQIQSFIYASGAFFGTIAGLTQTIIFFMRLLEGNCKRMARSYENKLKLKKITNKVKELKSVLS